MSMRFARLCFCFSALVTIAMATGAEDLHFKKSISVEGNKVSTSETWVKGGRERTVTASPAGNIVTLRQCDLKRTVTLNEQSQSYLVLKDAEDESLNKDAALMMTGGPAPTSGGSITQTVTLTDTGERKQMSGYAARHLKTKVVLESSADACTKTNQTYEIDGWYADIAKAPLSCAQSLPPIRQGSNCADRVIVRRKGAGKPGYPLHEIVTLQNEGSAPTKIEVVTSDISKESANSELFDVPAAYHEVHSETELYVAALPQAAPSGSAQQANSMPAGVPNVTQMMAPAPPGMNAHGGITSPMAMLQGMVGKAGGSSGMQGVASGAPVPVPQALGPKAPGKIRIGVAPAQAQMGQGNTSQEDYGTPVRNAIILMMNGPAIEITALDARIPIQLQAEAQQKECDYVLMSNVAVKRNASTGLGKFMKAGSMAANFTPVGMMAHTMTSMNGALAAQAVMQTAAMTTQQQAMSQLSGFNGQIKSKDEVSIQYQLISTGQSQPKLDNTLRGKSKSDGEDVLTPLLQQAATTILTEVSKK